MAPALQSIIDVQMCCFLDKDLTHVTCTHKHSEAVAIVQVLCFQGNKSLVLNIAQRNVD